jgi:hypothetical protein
MTVPQVVINGVVVTLGLIETCDIQYGMAILTFSSGERLTVYERSTPETFCALVRWYNSIPRIEEVWQ